MIVAIQPRIADAARITESGSLFEEIGYDVSFIFRVAIENITGKRYVILSRPRHRARLTNQKRARQLIVWNLECASACFVGNIAPNIS